jgi:hypothetical protein
VVGDGVAIADALGEVVDVEVGPVVAEGTAVAAVVGVVVIAGGFTENCVPVSTVTCAPSATWLGS